MKRRTPLAIRPRHDSLMALWGKAVRVRWAQKWRPWACVRCGRQAPYKIDAAHIFSRGAHPRLKYHPDNGFPLCFVCHRWYDTHKGKGGEAETWARQVLGRRYDKLRVLERAVGKVDKVLSQIVLEAIVREAEGVGPA